MRIFCLYTHFDDLELFHVLEAKHHLSLILWISTILSIAGFWSVIVTTDVPHKALIAVLGYLICNGAKVWFK